uniref:MTOR-associated protein MEAK7 n=1 Tax=Tetraodon nigroviridis TaxID=99883 RepID=H3CTU7_TETNG
MGNMESVAVQKRLARFRPEDRPVVEGAFDRLQTGAGGPLWGPWGNSNPGDAARLFQASLGSVAPASMARRVYRCMRSRTPAAPGAVREQLVIFLADTLRGTAEERAPLVLTMSRPEAATPRASRVGRSPRFLEDLISSVVQILVLRERLRGWKPEKMGEISPGVKLLAEQMCSELKTTETGESDISCLEDWIFRISQVSLYLEILVTEGLNVSLSGRPAPDLLPPCRETPWDGLRCLLDIPTVMFLAPQLPDGLAAPWRLVFSTRLHGESFTRMVAGLSRHGPTLLLIKDTKGHVFGGFASHAWELKPQFQGDSRCFLFTVSPKLRVFSTTGYNDHFMYLNQHQQTMPNGLGMGGQHDYFGLWLDSDFGRGHSRARPTCTTYGSPQLSAEEDFSLDSMEVWAVGKPPEPEDEQGEEGVGKRSVLDMDPEVQAIMEMTGKSLHSQGLREPEEDPD